MKIRNNSIVFLMLFSLSLFSQESDSARTRSKIEIGAVYSPDYSFRVLKADPSVQWIADIRDTLELPRLGQTAGLNFIFHIHERIFLGTGFLFSDKGEKITKYFLGNPSSGELPVNSTLTYHYHYLDIPVRAGYHFSGSKIKFYLTAGISANIFIGQKTTSVWEYGNGYSEKTNLPADPEISTFNIAAVAGFGVDCPATDKFGFKIEPLYRRSLMPIMDAPVKEYLYSAGLSIGLFYKL